MKATRTPRVKICCIGSVEEAALAVEYGASALGLVSQMPSGPGVISDELIAEIAATVPPAIGTFLLTSRQSVREIVAQQHLCRTNTLQICDHLTTGTHCELKQALPGIAVVQVVHVTGPESVEEAVHVAPSVDAILLDSGNQRLAVKELGGTGRTHDWSLSRTIRERVGIPLFLAGGLTRENVGQATEEVGPFGIDLCSGVRTDGKLDAAKLGRFFAAVRGTAPLS
ncbi:MAG TPA: phosphoribosylanthranilate isomerase [Terriglobales bacterium]|nr:phosphoribosylanthranilate isomerase [Terriglobales bacterium]